MSGARAAGILVIGLGNPDRGDDGAGPQVMKLLAGRLPPDAVIAEPGTDIITLVPEWAKYSAVICVDAALPLTAPGTVHRFDLAACELPRERLAPSSHMLGLADAVALSRALGEAPRDIIVLAVEGECFDAGTGLTRRVADALADIAGRVIGEVEVARRRG
jgi:hydrogenase maturation protease